MHGLSHAPVFDMQIAALAAGCAPTGGLTTGANAPRAFDLVGRREVAGGIERNTQRLQNLQIVVDEPTALRSLDREMILEAMSSSQITSLAGASRSDRLTRLVEARMIAAFGDVLSQIVGWNVETLGAPRGHSSKSGSGAQPPVANSQGCKQPGLASQDVPHSR